MYTYAIAEMCKQCKSGSDFHAVLDKIREDYDYGDITLDEKGMALAVMHTFMKAHMDKIMGGND